MFSSFGLHHQLFIYRYEIFERKLYSLWNEKSIQAPRSLSNDLFSYVLILCVFVYLLLGKIEATYEKISKLWECPVKEALDSPFYIKGTEKHGKTSSSEFNDFIKSELQYPITRNPRVLS